MALILVLFLFWMAGSMPPSALASEASGNSEQAEHRLLRVAFPIAEGYTMRSENGQPYGLVVDFLNEIAKYTGWQYEYVPTDSDSLIDDYLDGKFDLMGGTYYMEGMEEYFAYPAYNCGYSQVVLLARKDDERIKSYDLSTFNGKTIGVYERATENIRRLQDYLRIQDLDCQIKYYSYDDLSEESNLHRFLEDGEVDLLVGNSSESNDKFYAAAAFDSQAHYIVTPPQNQDIVDELNRALENIYAADPNFARKHYASNFLSVSVGFAGLTAAEKAYVQQKGTVTVAVPRKWHPMFCMDNDDYHNGFVPDVLAEISAYSGLEFDYVFCDSYADTLAKVQTGQADMLGFFVGSEEDALGRQLALTESYADIACILVRNKNTNYPAQGLTAGLLEGRNKPDNIEADHIVYYKNANDALSDVNRGKIDFFYGIAAHVEDIIRQENYTNIVQVSLVNDTVGNSFALPVPVQPELFSLLNKAINNLPSSKKAAISSRNTVSIGETHMSLTSFVYANPLLSILLVAFLLVMVILAIVLVARFRLRAAAMQMNLSKAEAESRAKSEFLSRMSHEIRTPMNAIVGLADLTIMVQNLPDKAQQNLIKIKSSSHYLLSLINDILDMSRIESGKMELERTPFSLSVLLCDIESMLSGDAANRQLTFQIENHSQDDVVVGDGIRLRQVILNLLSNAFKFTPAQGQVRLIVEQTDSDDTSATYTIRVIDSGVGIDIADQERIFHSFEQVRANITKSQGTGLGLAISKSILELMDSQLKLESALGQGSQFYFTVTLPKGQLDELPVIAPAPAEDTLQGVAILLAEDNDLNAEIATELLEAQGARVTRAVDGQAALEQFAQSAPDTFQLVLMDIMMPRLNGLEATKAIRALPRPDAGRIPIVAMTANSFKEDVETALTAGMNAFISKPVDVRTLYSTLYDVLEAVR